MPLPRSPRGPRGAAVAAVALALGVCPPALAAPAPGGGSHHYAFHPLTGDAYLLRDTPAEDPPEDGEQDDAEETAPERTDAPAQELLHVPDPDPAAQPGADEEPPEEELVPLAHTPVADPADFFVVAPDGVLHTVHSGAEGTLLASYREPDAPAGAEEAPADADGDGSGAYTVETHPLPDGLDLVAVRSDERGVFLLTGDGSVLLLEHTGGADGTLEITLAPHPGPAPEPDPRQAPEETAASPDRPAPAAPRTGEAEAAAAVPDGAERPRGPQPETAAADTAPSEETAGEPGAPPGALVMTLPGDPVLLSDPQVSADGSHQRATGDLAPATVSDLRGTGAGWSLVGQVGDLRGSGGASIAAHLLGWAPAAEVLDGPDGSGVRPGEAVRPGDGLAVPRTLCAGEPGASSGVFACWAGLQLGIPADTPPGEYAGTLTLTLS